MYNHLTGFQINYMRKNTLCLRRTQPLVIRSTRRYTDVYTETYLTGGGVGTDLENFNRGTLKKKKK